MGVPMKKLKAVKTAQAVVKTVVEKPGTIYGYEEQVDRLSVIQKKFTAIPKLAELLKEKSEIEKQLREAADKKVTAEESAIFVGKKNNFSVEPKAMQRSIPSMTEVKLQMGEELFMTVCSVSMGDIDKYLSAEQKGKCLSEARTGPRKGKLVEKG